MSAHAGKRLLRPTISFIIRRSNGNMPGVVGITHSPKRTVIWPMTGITPMLHRAGHSWLLIDRPGGGIFFYRISKILPAAAPLCHGSSFNTSVRKSGLFYNGLTTGPESVRVGNRLQGTLKGAT